MKKIFLLIVAISAFACCSKPEKITEEVWGISPKGEEVILYTMTNASGASVQVTNLGAALIAVTVPDRSGEMANVVLGYQDMKSHFNDPKYFGMTVGRYANRLDSAAFTLDGTRYQLTPNEGPNQLHGGPGSLAYQMWASRVEDGRVVFSIVSPDGDQGYPGNLTVETSYTWSDDNELIIDYTATTDAATVINLTNHAHFNLGPKGGDSGSVLSNVMQLNSSKFVPTGLGNIPTGELWDVEGTPMDFRTPKALGQDMGTGYSELTASGGYDRCWVIDGWQKGVLAEAGSLVSPETGRRMTILTTQPSVQVYTCDFLRGAPLSVSGREYDNMDGVALECQGLPDAPNHANFPDQTLRPGEEYTETIIYKFDTVQ
jgi:aldose 1-epimerase